MMMDGKGCTAIALGLAGIGLFVGLILYWIGLPWWVPLAGLGLPVIAGLLLMLMLIVQWMKDGSH